MSTLTTLEPRVVPRDGLGSLAARLSQQPCGIAYLGASVTVQRHGYRPRLHELLRSRFGQEHRSVMAAVGAVGVVSAAFLTDDLVTSHDPDLCLIEYTAAELVTHTPLERIEAALGGIVAKLQDRDIQPCFLHLPRRRWTARADDVLASFERVADRHGSPSIDLIQPIRDAIATGDLHVDKLYRDVVHTTDDGAQLVAEAADRAIGSLTEAGSHEKARPGHALDHGFAGAHLLPAKPGDAAGPASMRLFRLHRPYLELAPGTLLQRRFDERLAGLAVLAGPESGEIRVTDSTGSQTAMVWDEDCHYERFMTVELDRDCPPGADVRVELTDRVPDYSSCRRPVEPPERRDLRVIGYLLLPD
jgi:GDSL-like lipase/acylhydrolase family protein